jgi:hypothetical protein
MSLPLSTYRHCRSEVPGIYLEQRMAADCEWIIDHAELELSNGTKFEGLSIYAPGSEKWVAYAIDTAFGLGEVILAMDKAFAAEHVPCGVSMPIALSKRFARFDEWAQARGFSFVWDRSGETFRPFAPWHGPFGSNSIEDFRQTADEFLRDRNQRQLVMPS